MKKDNIVKIIKILAITVLYALHIVCEKIHKIIRQFWRLTPNQKGRKVLCVLVIMVTLTLIGMNIVHESLDFLQLGKSIWLDGLTALIAYSPLFGLVVCPAAVIGLMED